MKINLPPELKLFLVTLSFSPQYTTRLQQIQKYLENRV